MSRPGWTARLPLRRLMPASLFGRLALLLLLFALLSHVLALRMLFELRPTGPAPGPGWALGWLRLPPPGPPPPGVHLGLWLDIGLRLAVLTLAAWIGARWLSLPIKRLAAAAQAFGQGPQAGGAPDLPGVHGAPGGCATPVQLLAEDGPRECQDAARVFNHMQTRISAQLDERNRFVAAVSHDLRTPLTRLRLRTEGLADAGQRAQFKRDIHEMEQMIRVTLDHLRGAAEAEAVELLDVQALVEALTDDQQACGHDVQWLGQARPLRASPSALRRCLDNLVDNALRYGGQARITLLDSATACRLEVQDAGPGLPESELLKVLAPFYRVEGSRNRRHGGVGLGLAIAHDIARQHGGTLALHNAALDGRAGGLVAVLTLPR